MSDMELLYFYSVDGSTICHWVQEAWRRRRKNRPRNSLKTTKEFFEHSTAQQDGSQTANVFMWVSETDRLELVKTKICRLVFEVCQCRHHRLTASHRARCDAHCQLQQSAWSKTQHWIITAERCSRRISHCRETSVIPFTFCPQLGVAVGSFPSPATGAKATLVSPLCSPALL